MIPIIAYIAGMFYTEHFKVTKYAKYLAKADAAGVYLSKTDANRKYLDLTTFNTLITQYPTKTVFGATPTKTDAMSSFLKKMNTTDVFLTKADADKRYITKENTSVRLRYEFTYKEFSIDKWNEPFRPGGYPLAFAHGYRLKSTSKITLLTHTFDKDNLINDLYLDYKMVVTMRGGKTKEPMLASILNMKPLSVGDTYMLNKTFTISDLVKNYTKIHTSLSK